jgi:hypothetical protein
MKYVLFASLLLAQTWSDGFDCRTNPKRHPGTHYSGPVRSTDPVGYVVPVAEPEYHLLTATETAAAVATFTPWSPIP